VSHTWENNSISIVLLPSEVRYPKVHEQLKQWIGDGLLGNFVWMTAENIKPEEFGPPTIRGTVWGLDHNRELVGIEVDPFEEMAKNKFKTVRLLAVRILSNTFEPDETEYKKFNVLSEYIRLSLPLATSNDEPGNKIKKTDLRRINLVVHPTDLKSTEYSQVFKGHWDHHVIASPEDRKTPLSADRFVKEDARFPKFISMHIAATGGLWNGISRSPFDELAKPESGAHSYQLSRIFVNSVLTDGLSRRVAASVLSDLADPTIDLHQKGLVAEIPDTVFIPDIDAEAWVDEMVKIVFEFQNGDLTFKEPPTSDELKWVKWTEWQGIKDFLAFAGKKIISMPKWCWIWLRRRIGKKLTDSLAGPDGGLVIGVDQDDAADIRDKGLFDAMATINGNITEAQKALVTPYRQTNTASRPELWSDIRKLIYGLLEGGDLSKYGIEKTNDRSPIFSKVGDLIQDPKEIYQLPGGLADLSEITEITWKNIDEAAELVEIQANHIASRKVELDSKVQQLVSIDTELKELLGETAVPKPRNRMRGFN
jgi:hypothetical protein